MNVLITGGAGFLGAHMAEALLNKGDQVYIIDNYETAERDSLPRRDGLFVTEGSVTDGPLMARLFEDARPDIVIHAAASYKDPNNWEKDADVNVRGTVITLNEAKKHGVTRFIYLQTALCYGPALERPITEKHPLSPITSYSVSKTAGEQYVKLSGLSYVSLRLANIYGARHYSGPIPTFYRKIKNGEPCAIYDTRRDFFDVADFLSLMALVIDRTDINGCFNVSSGHDNSIEEIYSLVYGHIHGKTPENITVHPLVSEDVASLLLDPSEAKRQFGWECKVTLDEGLKNLLAWYDANGIGETYTHLKIK